MKHDKHDKHDQHGQHDDHAEERKKLLINVSLGCCVSLAVLTIMFAIGMYLGNKEKVEPKKEAPPQKDNVVIKGNISGGSDKGTAPQQPDEEEKQDAYPQSVFVSGNNIYMAGYGINAQGKRVAKLWTNGAAQVLVSESQDVYANAVFASDKDVYVVGNEVTPRGNSVAKLWKNGRYQRFRDKETFVSSAAYSVFASGSDVYVAGYGDTGNGRVAVLWENGKARRLTGKADNSESCAASVFVDGKDVYVAVVDAPKSGGGALVTVWKNGSVYQNISNGNQRTQRSVIDSPGDNSVCLFVSKGDVYLTGGLSSANSASAAFWKNGRLQRLDGGAILQAAESVFVSDNNVYVAGYEPNEQEKRIAIFWKNGKPERLSDENRNAKPKSIFVSGDDVYVAGHEENEKGVKVATLWKASDSKTQ